MGIETTKKTTEVVKSHTIKPSEAPKAPEISPEKPPKSPTEDLISKIKNNEQLRDPVTTDIVERFTYAIKSGNVEEIAKIAFAFIKNTLGSSDGKESGFWFQDNKEIKDFTKRITENGNNMTAGQLQIELNKILNAIKNEEGVKKKIGLTYSLSRILDQIQYKNKSKERLKGSSDGNKDNTANKLSVARMAQQVKLGDILAVNKSEQGKELGDKLLDGIAGNDLNTGHILIITAVDKDIGKITVAQSTQNKINGGGSGVEIGVDLGEYTNKFDAITIATLRPEENIAKTLVQNVLSKEGGKYSNKAAAAGTILGQDLFSAKDEYNCVTLISRSFPAEVSDKWKKRTNPSQILENMNPVYVTIAGKEIGGS